MRKFKLEVDCDNAAFDDENFSEELAGILLHTAAKIKQGITRNVPVPVRDSNGNTVGSFQLKAK